MLTYLPSHKYHGSSCSPILRFDRRRAAELHAERKKNMLLTQVICPLPTRRLRRGRVSHQGTDRVGSQGGWR